MGSITYLQAFEEGFVFAFAPELTLLAGLLLMIVLPNLGKATFRVPGTQVRLPYFLGGERYSWVAHPRLPSIIAVATLATSFFFIYLSLAEDGGLQRIALVTAMNDNHTVPSYAKEIFLVNGFSRVFELIFIGAIGLAAFASMNRLETYPRSSRSTDALYKNRRQGDFYILMLTCALGMSVVALAQDLFVLFVGLELASFSSYVLVAFHKESKAGVEGGMKYFIVGSVASGVGLYGMSMLYLWAGSLQFSTLAAAFASTGMTALPLIAIGFVLVGFGFKVSAAPFHFAAPDAYAGASSPVAGVLSTASKAMGMVGLIRMLLVVAAPEAGESGAVWLVLVGALSVVTMTWGNIAALGSTNPKRMLAYSSVAHAGYMLAALTAVGAWAWDPTLSGDAGEAAVAVLTALIFHMIVLVCFKLGAFLVLSVLEGEGEVSSLDSLKGLAKREPFLGVAMFVFMLSLAGVPPLAGFLSKLLVIMSIVKVAVGDIGLWLDNSTVLGLSDLHWVWWLAFIMVINSAISVFYYLRVGVVMFFDEPEEGKEEAPVVGWQVRTAIFACLVFTVFFGIASDRLLELAEFAAQSLNYKW